jgi:cytoskeletal protein CcmA (bactofilin family)
MTKKNNSTADNFLLGDSEISGNINTNSSIRIDGKLLGNLNTAQKLVVGNSGVILGTVHCQNAQIEGTIEGDINVQEVIDLRSGAKIKGDILSTKIILEDNCQIQGKLKLKSK